MAVITATAILHNIAIDLREPDFGLEPTVHIGNDNLMIRDEELGALVRQRIVQQWFQLAYVSYYLIVRVTL